MESSTEAELATSLVLLLLARPTILGNRGPHPPDGGRRMKEEDCCAAAAAITAGDLGGKRFVGVGIALAHNHSLLGPLLV